MAIERKARKIPDAQGHEHTYSLTEFGAEEGFELALELWGIAGDALAGLAIEGGAMGLGLVFQRLASEIQRKGGVKLLKRILKNTVRDGRLFDAEGKGEGERTFTFDVTYKANYGEALRAVSFVLEANFASFFGGFDGKLKEVMTAILQPSALPSSP